MSAGDAPRGAPEAPVADTPRVVTGYADEAVWVAQGAEPPSVVAALSAVAAAVGAIPKEDNHGTPGEYGHFRYRGIERIMAAVGPALTSHGVVVLPRVIEREVVQKPRGNNGNLWDHVRLTVEYDFYGPRGDHLTARVVAEGLDNGDKASPKALTMAYKSVLLQVLGIADDAHDPDRLNPADGGPAAGRQPQPAKPSARKAPAKKAPAKKAPARRPPVEDPRSLLEVLHGPEHAAEVALLLDRLNKVPTDRRKAVKDAFVVSFGSPSVLHPDRLERAKAWVGDTEAAGWVPAGVQAEALA